MPAEFATSAPLLTGLRDKGATFYTVSTALNDIDKTLMDSNYVMTPSKFVCLNLPKWQRWADTQSIFEEPENIGTPLTTDPNVILPKIIQNYIENAIALSANYRSDDSLQSISEAMFWKMLVRMGGMKLKDDKPILVDGEEVPTYSEDTSAFEGNYQRVVVYSGDINVLNHITKMGQSYTEIFMHVPSQARMLEELRFTDPGFKLQLEQIPGPGEESPEYTIGLEDHPDSNTKAIYDTDDLKYDFTPKNRLGVYFDELSTSTDEKDKVDGKDFEFNVVLVYYDIWNREHPDVRKTNLYGILFLDKFTDTGAGSYTIDTLDKYVPDAVTTGNGYAIRLNIKTSSNQAQTTSEVSINDYNSVSMELYMTALQRINDITDKYEEALDLYKDIQSKMSAIYAIIPRITETSELEAKLTELQRQVQSNQQTERISNEDLFEVFSQAVEATKSTDKDVNIQYISGNYSFNKDGTPIVTDPEGSQWKWDASLSKWTKIYS